MDTGKNSIKERRLLNGRRNHTTMGIEAAKIAIEKRM
jgi:hypothetical protein